MSDSRSDNIQYFTGYGLGTGTNSIVIASVLGTVAAIQERPVYPDFLAGLAAGAVSYSVLQVCNYASNMIMNKLNEYLKPTPSEEAGEENTQPVTEPVTVSPDSAIIDLSSVQVVGSRRDSQSATL